MTGASGGVGTALIQLCRLLGAVPHAVSSAGKERALGELGGESVIGRGGVSDWPAAVNQATGGRIINAVIDLAGGAMTNPLMDVMIRRMVERRSYPRLSIASAGNVTKILWTRIYLYQIQVFGVSHGTREEADQLIRWIRVGDLRPVRDGTFRLSELRCAEDYFVGRGSDYIGKIAIVPDSDWERHGAPFTV